MTLTEIVIKFGDVLGKVNPNEVDCKVCFLNIKSE